MGYFSRFILGFHFHFRNLIFFLINFINWKSIVNIEFLINFK